MTVTELIEMLQRLPGDVDVVLPQESPVSPDVWDLGISAVEYDDSNSVVKLFPDRSETQSPPSRKETDPMVHKVLLSNGRTLIVEERTGCLSIAAADGAGEDVDAYICQVSADGVLVMPNSGDTTHWLTQRLEQVEPAISSRRFGNEPYEHESDSLAGRPELLTAAPELLAALQMMLDKFENDVRPGEAGWDAVEAARTAVAKVTNRYCDYRPE